MLAPPCSLPPLPPPPPACVQGERLASLSLEPTSAAGGVEAELQRLLEHDSYAERERMKELTRQELFTP